jgi:hypothetical protein
MASSQLRFQSLNYQTGIYVNRKSDKYKSWITGCAILSDNRVLLADYNNSKLKVAIHTQYLVQEKILDTEPYDTALLPLNQAAITLPNKGEVMIVETAKLVPKLCVQVFRLCLGICSHTEHMFVLCKGPYSILQLDMQGNRQRNISINDTIKRASCVHSLLVSNYIAVSNDLQHLYITTPLSNSVFKLTTEGELTGSFTNDNLKDAQGLLKLDDSSILVCCCTRCTLVNISENLETGQLLIGQYGKTQCIDYRPETQELYVGSNDVIEVFTVSYEE